MNALRTIVTAAALVAALSGAAAEPPSECTLRVTYLLGPTDELELGFTIHQCPDLWSVTLDARAGDAGGEVQWRALDTLHLRDVAADETVVSQTCSFEGAPDAGIVAIARQTDADDFSGIRAAWRPDPIGGRWARIDAASVACWNEVAGQT